MSRDHQPRTSVTAANTCWGARLTVNLVLKPFSVMSISWSVLQVEVLFERVEPVVPVAGERGEELLRHLHGCGPEAIADPTPLTGFRGEQAGVQQQGHVFGDRLPGDRQPLGEIRCR